jgi:hypothetical protein
VTQATPLGSDPDQAQTILGRFREPNNFKTNMPPTLGQKDFLKSPTNG